MKIDFSGALKKGLDSTKADDQVQADVDALIKRIAESVPAGSGAKAAPPTEGQLAAIAKQAIQDHQLMAVLEQAIVDEVVRSAKAPEPVAAK